MYLRMEAPFVPTKPQAINLVASKMIKPIMSEAGSSFRISAATVLLSTLIDPLQLYSTRPESLSSLIMQILK